MCSYPFRQHADFGDKHMKKILLAATVAALASTSAFAADMAARPYIKAPVYAPAPVYNWTGFYIGGHVGAAFGGDDGYTSDFPAGTLASSNRDAAFMGGGQIGADYQFAPNWLVGIEGQISAISSGDRRFTDTVDLGSLRDRNDWIASVTGRLGYTWGPGLIYAKGGVAFRDSGGLTALNLVPGDIVTTDRNDTGYTVGAGLEYMFAPGWSGKVEYQYYNFDRTNISTLLAPGSFSGTAISYTDDIHTVKVGLNYRFNWGGPVVAKY
jgi:outer membrane immunogenic protein